MSRKFHIVNTLKEALLRVKKEANSLPNETKSGLICGLVSVEDTWLTYCICPAATEQLVPYGQSPVGVYFIEKESEEVIADLTAKLIKRKTGKVLLLIAGDDGELEARCMDMKSKKIFETEVTYINVDQLLDPLLTIRVTGKFPVKFPVGSDEEKTRENIGETFAALEKSCKSLCFSLKNSSFILSQKGVDKSKTVSDLYSFMEDDELREIDGISAPADLKRKMKEKVIKQRISSKMPLQFSVINEKDSGDSNSEKENENPEPVVSDGNASFSITCDVPLLVHKQLDSGNLVRSMLTGITKQIDDLKLGLLKFSNLSSSKFEVPHPYSFWPKDIYAGFLTVVYPKSYRNSDLESTRKEQHVLHLLPLDKPLIRKTMAYRFPGDEVITDKLCNVHDGLLGSVKGGKLALVQGTYAYYHYTQDHMDDSGWGCAYRSLQTIISWFIYQGYIESKVPTHKEIQQVLVDVGDKPANFVGSQKWIGSQEVNYVLNQLYGVVSKIMFVSSGKDLPAKARELFHHFQTQGTPVMIGGGVLAHTIIGVDFNEDTGEVKYLVLDPHYTGAEDVATIQKKGWCGWKMPKFWRDDSFYNLCLPQRPAAI